MKEAFSSCVGRKNMYVNTQDLRNLAQQHRDRGNALIAEAIEAIADVLDHMAQEQNTKTGGTTNGSTESGENASAE